MADALRLSILLAAIDKVSAPLDRIAGGAKKMTADLAAARKQLTDLQRTQSNVGGYKAAETRLNANSAALEEARAKTAALRAEIAGVDAPTDRMTRALARAERQEQQLTERHEAQGRELADLRRRLEGAGVDVTELGRDEERLADSIAEANRRLREQQDRLERVNRVRAAGEGIKSAGNKMMAGGAIATATITAPLIAFAAASREAALESRAATGQVQASLTDMGDKSGRTLEQLKAQASALQGTSLYDDDDIMREMTANLLTFGKVSGTVFDRAQRVGVGMSAKLGQSLQSSGMQLGKALNNPIKGVGALAKVGINFDDSQKAMIATMVKSGNVAGAQGIILNELESQFGSAAQAARDAKPGQDTVDQWRDFQETVGEMVLNVLPPLTKFLTDVLTRFNNMSPAMQQNVFYFAAVLAVIGPVVTVLGVLTSAIGFVTVALAPLGLTVAATFGVFILAALAIGVAAYLIYTHWETIKKAFGTAITAIGIWWGMLNNGLASGWAAIINGFARGGAAIAAAWNAIKAFFMAGINWWISLHMKFFSIGANLIKGLIDGFLGGARNLKNTIVGVATNVRDWFAEKLGIRSPSRVFMGLGGFLTQGLARGVDKGANGPLARVRALAARMGAAMALGVSAPALASTAGITFVGGETAVPRTASAASGNPAAAASRATAPMVVNITITGVATDSAREIEAAVRRAMADVQRQADAAARSSYADD